MTGLVFNKSIYHPGPFMFALSVDAIKRFQECHCQLNCKYIEGTVITYKGSTKKNTKKQTKKYKKNTKKYKKIQKKYKKIQKKYVEYSIML